MLSTYLLLGFSLVAAITDVWRQKIYNWTTVPGMLIGIIVSGIEPGGIGWEDSLLGFLGCGLIMVACLVSFPVGGGDVKLIAMQGAFLGWYHGLECMLWTFVIGAAFGLCLLIWQWGLLRLLFRGWQQALSLARYGTWIPATDDERMTLDKLLYLAPAAFMAACIVRFSLLS